MQKDSGISLGSVHLRNGAIFLIRERKPMLSMKLFERALSDGMPGLCVTRQFPDRLKMAAALFADDAFMRHVIPKVVFGGVFKADQKPVMPLSCAERQLVVVHCHPCYPRNPWLKLDHGFPG